MKVGYAALLVLGVLACGWFLPTWSKSSKVKEINQCINDHERVVVKFYRPTCPACAYIKPLYRQAKNEYGQKVFFYEVNLNTTNDQVLKKAYDFKTVPTVIYYKNGHEVTRHGSKNKKITYHEIQENIKNIL